MSDRPEDEMPIFYIEAAQAVVGMPPFPSIEETGKAIEAVRQAILKAREEAFEELRKAGIAEFASQDGFNIACAIRSFKPKASAIRLHSQKGER